MAPVFGYSKQLNVEALCLCGYGDDEEPCSALRVCPTKLVQFLPRTEDSKPDEDLVQARVELHLQVETHIKELRLVYATCGEFSIRSIRNAIGELGAVARNQRDTGSFRCDVLSLEIGNDSGRLFATGFMTSPRNDWHRLSAGKKIDFLTTSPWKNLARTEFFFLIRKSSVSDLEQSMSNLVGACLAAQEAE
jgi:hypothetical protein